MDYNLVPSLPVSLSLLVRGPSSGAAAAALLDPGLLDDDDEPKPGTALV